VAQALVLPAREGAAPRALLLQLERDAAAVALDEDQSLVVLLAFPPEGVPPPEEIAARTREALGKERPEVLAGTAGTLLHVALVGCAPQGWQEAAPPTFQPLARSVCYWHLSTGGVVTGPPGPVRDTLNRALLLALREEGPPPASAEALKQAEQHGEATLGEEGLYGASQGLSRMPVTVGLGVLLPLVFVLEVLWGGSEFPLTLRHMGATVTDAGQWWRLFSHGFLHAGVVHLLSNLWGFVLYGPTLEHVLGSSRFLLVYTLSVLGGALASRYGHAEVLSVGASGGLFGLMGALLVLAWRGGPLLPTFQRRSVKHFVTYLLVVNLFASLKPGVDLLAHLGGGVTGAALVLGGVATWRLPRLWAGERPPRWNAVLYRVLGAVALGVNVVALGLAFHSGRPWRLRPSEALVRVRLPEAPVSIEVPPEAATRYRRIPLEHGWEESVYGTPLEDPIIALVSVRRLDAPIAPEEAEETLRAWLEALKDPPEGKAYASPPRLETWEDGRRVIALDQRCGGGVHCPRWVLFEGAVMVDLELSFAPGADEGWTALEPRIARSLRFEPPTP
jgi:membrane associated rhomboid family serine protease